MIILKWYGSLGFVVFSGKIPLCYPIAGLERIRKWQ